MKKFLIFSILLSPFSVLTAQTTTTTYADSVAGFALNIPAGWDQQSFDKGETAFRSSNADGTGIFDVNLKKLDEGVTAKQHLEYLESFMPAAGFSKNFMSEESRSITGADAAAVGADDIYGGAYTIDKNGVTMVQMIFVYRKGRYAYITVQTCPKDQLKDLQPSFAVFYDSFHII
ncbi:MAG: hypothetical protein HY064_13620 [Bacteroidetes bacterium]|nr:hypothetical protein [Bacteroidota bacterium]